jgi:transposase
MPPTSPPSSSPYRRAYRSEYLIERGFWRLKRPPLWLIPMYLARDEYDTELIRLLSVGLRVLTRLEFVVRRQWATRGEKVAGLYAGNPKRGTAQPTAECLLQAFQELTLTVIHGPRKTRRHLTPLSAVQQRILGLLNLCVTIYTRLCADFPEWL